MSHSWPALRTLFDVQTVLTNNRVLSQSEAEIADFIAKAFPFRQRQSLTGEPLHAEDTPGNFTVEKRGGKVCVRIYDRFGGAQVTEIPLPDGAAKRP